MMRPIRIDCVAASKPAESGILDEALLSKERRSRKVGALPLKARMVLEASQRCIAADADGAAGTGIDRTRLGVSLGTLFGSIDVAEQCLKTVHGEGFSGVTPSWYATGLPNATAAIVASIHDLKGPNLTSLGYQAGIDAIIFGCRQILAGNADAVLAGGFDMPSDRYSAKLLETSLYAGVGAIQPGAGLVWLSGVPDGPSSRSGEASIVGWATGSVAASLRQPAADLAGDKAILQLIRDAARGRALDSAPQIHVVYPGSTAVDHLAATAPLRLVEDILTRGGAGLHALLVQGFRPATCTCLLVEKGPGAVVQRPRVPG